MTMRTRVIARLNAGLSGVVADWGPAPQGFDLPRVVVWRVGGGDDMKSSGPSPLRTALLQVDCYAGDVDAATGLADQVRGLLAGWQDLPAIKGCFLTAERDLPPDTEGAADVARITLDFTIKYQES